MGLDRIYAKKTTSRICGGGISRYEPGESSAKGVPHGCG